MAEFYEPHKDTLSIFNGVIANKELDRVVSIAIRGNNKQKEIYSIQKSGELMKSETNKEVFIIVNHSGFDISWSISSPSNRWHECLTYL